MAQVGAIAVLTRMFGWSPFPATAVGLGLAAVLNFFGHTAWTFCDYPVSDPRALAGRYLRYQIATIVSLGANAAVTVALVSLAPLPVEVANIAAVIVCALPNYLLVEKSFVAAASAPRRTNTYNNQGRSETPIISQRAFRPSQ